LHGLLYPVLDNHDGSFLKDTAFIEVLEGGNNDAMIIGGIHKDKIEGIGESGQAVKVSTDVP